MENGTVTVGLPDDATGNVTVKIDGVFDYFTENAVRKFQTDNGLKVTGSVDEKTAMKLKLI